MNTVVFGINLSGFLPLARVHVFLPRFGIPVILAARVAILEHASSNNSTNSPTSTSGTLTPDTSDYEASVDSTPNTPTNTPTEEQDEAYSLNPAQLNQAIQMISSSLQEFNEEHPSRPKKPEANKYARNLNMFNKEFPVIRKSTRLAEKPRKTYSRGAEPRKK